MDTSTKCFRCYRRPLLDPKELRVSICHIDQGDFDIQGLRCQWRKVILIESHVRLTLDFRFGWPNNGIVWAQLCNFVQEVSPQIFAFSTTLSPQIDDKEWAALLQQLPSTLQELTITTERDTPLAYEQIGRSFPDLQSFLVHHGDGCPLFVPREKLPMVIGALPALRKITLWNLPEVSYQISWQQLVSSIQSRQDLEEANIFQGYTPQGRAVNPLSDEELEAIQYRPRLNEAKQQLVADGNLPDSLEEFVDTIIAVQDRVDCLDYLFSNVDPNLYAPAAVASLMTGQSRETYSAKGK